MNIIRLTEDDAIELMADHVDRAIRNPEIRVFQILGYFGIGKRTAIRQLFDRYGFEPVEHDYTILETDRPIVDKVAAYPSAVHVWDDVFRTNILYPDVLSALQKIQDGSIPFQGTFLLIANDQEFPDHGFPPFPGVHIDFEDDPVLLNHLERQMRREGQPESAIRHRLSNVALWKKEDERHAIDKQT
jgi:hypothetical protein